MAGYKNFQVKRNKQKKRIDIYDKGRNFNKGSKSSKSERLMEGIGIWASFYRANPQRFVRDYLNIHLKLFQQILIYMMFNNNYTMYLAARSQGKTWLTAVFCVSMAILYPGIKIIIASGTKGQAMKIVTEKIPELLNSSPNLKREIKDIKTSMNTDEPNVIFHSGSWIKVVASNEKARSARAHIIIYDEFRIIDLGIIKTVLRRFLGTPRQPAYLRKDKYAGLKERNKEIYLSSAWYKHHWSWNRLLAFKNKMTGGSKYFLCGLPYQLSIAENLLDSEQVLDEMSEDDFDPVAWSMEMECLFFGESENAYFKFADLDIKRVLEKPVYPKSCYSKIKDAAFKYTEKKPNEIRLLCCDIAGMAGKENDASVYSLLCLIPKKNGYERHIRYMESVVGGHTVTQSLRIRQLFYDLDCDYVVLDTQSFGLGIFDQLSQNQYDKERKTEYEAWTCINDEKMADRCLATDAIPIIYSIKASLTFNSDCAIGLKDDFRRNKVKLLVSENDGKQYLNEFRSYATLPIEDQVVFESVYKQTSLLIHEMVNLERDMSKLEVVRLKEPKNKRKDRYSSVSYGNYIARELERDLIQPNNKYAPVFLFN